MRTYLDLDEKQSEREGASRRSHGVKEKPARSFTAETRLGWSRKRRQERRGRGKSERTLESSFALLRELDYKNVAGWAI